MRERTIHHIAQVIFSRRFKNAVDLIMLKTRRSLRTTLFNINNVPSISFKKNSKDYGLRDGVGFPRGNELGLGEALSEPGEVPLVRFHAEPEVRGVEITHDLPEERVALTPDAVDQPATDLAC